MISYYLLVAVCVIAVFAVMMAVWSGRREQQARLLELRRRLGAPAEQEHLLGKSGKLENFLAESGLDWSPRLLVTRSLTAGAAGALVGLVIATPVHAFLFGGLGLGVFPLWVSSKRTSRLTRCDEQLPGALQLMVLALRAGHALPGALALAARESVAPLSSELRRAVEEHTLGRPLGQVVTNLALRLPSSDTAQTFAVAVLVLEQTGGNLIHVLDRIVDSSRARTQYRAKVRALTAQGRFGAYFLAVMPFGFAAAASLMDPKYLSKLFGSPLLLVLFAVFWGLGMMWATVLLNKAKASG
jgi:tight adherence protein B